MPVQWVVFFVIENCQRCFGQWKPEGTGEGVSSIVYLFGVNLCKTVKNRIDRSMKFCAAQGSTVENRVNLEYGNRFESHLGKCTNEIKFTSRRKF